jgi:hypothetical protein
MIKALLIKYAIKIIIVIIVLGLGIWYINSSLNGDSISYISLDNFMNAIGATDGNVASVNGCFMCKYINDLFMVLGVAAEKFWGVIVDNIWILMVIGFGIFLFVHTIKYFYNAMNDAVSMIGAKISDGSSGGSGGSGKSNSASGSQGNSASGKSSTGDSGNKSSSTSGDGFAPGVGGTAPKTNRYKYAQLEWLATSGTQYFITDVKPTDATGLKIKFNQSVSGDQSVVVSLLSNSKYFGVHVVGRLFLPFNEDWSGGDVGVNVATNSNYEVSINYMNDRKRYVNGVSKLDITNTSVSGQAIYLCDNHGTNSAKFHGRVYYLQITEDKSLVCDMVPVQCIIGGEVSGAIGMYDKVSHIFHPNIGVGKCTAGPIVGYLEKIQES